MINEIRQFSVSDWGFSDLVVCIRWSIDDTKSNIS